MNMILNYLKMKTKSIIILISVLFLFSCNSETESLELLNSIEFNSKELNLKKSEPTLGLLTSDELKDLLFLREEEKLARDVYKFSFDKYGSKIFSKIIESEEQHMSSVLKLLEKYNVEDPASDIIGEFNNPDLQELYDYLKDLSETSLLNAFLAGDKIEDLDILDLTENELRTSKLDLISVYSSLKCGSKNHLRSFYNQTLIYDGIYIPEYISLEEFDLIVTSPYEKCGGK